MSDTFARVKCPECGAWVLQHRLAGHRGYCTTHVSHGGLPKDREHTIRRLAEERVTYGGQSRSQLRSKWADALRAMDETE